MINSELAITVARASVLLFLGIVFLQSAVDKIFDLKGNIEWLKGHFANTPLKGFVPMMVGILTVMELASGLGTIIGCVTLVFFDNLVIGLYGLVLSAVSMIALVFGQRIAKDYEGAAALVPYFILTILGLILWWL